MTKKYNHALTLAFEIHSDEPNGEDITFDQFEKAVLRRIELLRQSGDEYKEAILPPYDTYEEDYFGL